MSVSPASLMNIVKFRARMMDSVATKEVCIFYFIFKTRYRSHFSKANNISESGWLTGLRASLPACDDGSG